MSDREGQYNKPSKLNAPKPGLVGESGTQQKVRRSKIGDVADTVADYVGPAIDSMKSALGVVDSSGGNPDIFHVSGRQKEPSMYPTGQMPPT